MTAPVAPRPVIVAPILFMRSFIRQDLDLLAGRFDVREVPSLATADLLRSLFALRGADLIFCWFGSIRFLPLIALARLLGKPVLIISGGYDVANEPGIDYGNMRGGPVAWLGRLAFRMASVVVPYSRAGQEETLRHAHVPLRRQHLVYLGFPPLGAARSVARRPMVLTVGRMDESTVRRKGLLTIARASRLIPDVEIVMAGGGSDAAMQQLQREAGPNVAFPGVVSDEVLLRLLSEATVYLQPSVHEAFGCAVAEAMLHGCIPIVSDRGSLPEVVGQSGRYVKADDPVELAAAVTTVLREPPSLPESPRDRVLRLFPLDLRRRELFSLVDALVSGQRG